MDKFERILEIINNYKKEADKIFSEYKKAEASARAKYSEAGFKTEFILNQWPKYAGKVRGNANLAIGKIEEIFDDLEAEFSDWILKPIESGTLQTLDCVKRFGLRLSEKELKVIEKGIADSSYLGRKIFSAIAKDNGFSVNYIGVDVLIDNLDVAKNVTISSIKAYAGNSEESFPGRDLIEHNIVDGVDYGEFTVPQMAIASQFPANAGSFQATKSLWERAKAPLLYRLSEEEVQFIGSKIEGLVDRWGDVNPTKADKLREEIPDLLSRLDSMPKDYGNVETLKKYYILGGSASPKEEKSEQEDSHLKSLDIVKQYAAKNGLVNEDILVQY